MKKILLIAVVFLSAFTNHLKAQDATDNTRLSEVLKSYYNIKNALVAGDGKTAATSATDFSKTLNGVSYQQISEGNVNTLLKDAGTIADAKSIEKQRVAFINFSSNMAEMAMALKLSDQPVYIQYCPMKKALWLSSEQNIKNPYYGNSMLTCGKVMDTIQ